MLEKMEFGKTGHLSTRVLFGAAAFYNTTDQVVADRAMEEVEKAGINHIDTAASYGEAEKRLGPWLKHNRKKVFLATKSEKRSYLEAKEQLYRSLDLLCVDSVDLWQMHCLIDFSEWDQAMDEERGAIRAFIEARQEGLVRFLGVTAHGLVSPGMHLKNLERFPFNSVLLPYNYPLSRNKTYQSDFVRLLNLCRSRNVAVQLIKTVCKGPWPDGAEPVYNTWYEPLDTQADIDLAIGWILKQEGTFIITPAEISIFPKVIKSVEKKAGPVEDEVMAEAARRLGLSNLFNE